MRNEIEGYWQQLSQVVQSMPHGLIAQAAHILLTCYRNDGTIFVLGNGGSAATASHLACDLSKGARVAGAQPFRVVPLTDNVPLMTAWANDVAYQHIFAEQLRPLVRTGDTVIAISASGNSPNVVEAVRLARANGATTIALTGATGGRVKRWASLTIPVRGGTIEQVEDAHLAIAHSLCVALRTHLQQGDDLLEVERMPAPLVLDSAR